MRRRLDIPALEIVRLALALSAVLPGLVSSQSHLRVGSAPLQLADPDPLESVGFGEGPYEEMEALLEVTIFNIDVLNLTVRVSPGTAARLASVLDGRTQYSEELADSVGRIMLEADDVWARQVFLRDVGLGRLTDGMRETAEKAADAGYISEEYASSFAAALPEWFGFLEERGTKEGDALYFRISGDRVRTSYRTFDGHVLLDDETTDRQSRLASIPSFFAPDTRFRRRLVESLLEDPERPR
ncbi:MAG TPA: hypothetical protein VLA09_05875 [Longimicrobiales bacterium]|nr:hypothetical protein [Longimicrobiales bacterium]